MRQMLWTAGYDGRIKYWDMATGTCKYTHSYVDFPINVIKTGISPEATPVLATGGYGQIILYKIDLEGQKCLIEIGKMQGHKASVTDLEFFDNGKYLCSCSEDKTIRFWDLSSKKTTSEFSMKAPVNVMAMHPNMTQCIFGTETGVIQIRDFRHFDKPDVTFTLNIPNHRVVQSMIISKDAKYLIVATRQGVIILYELLYENENGETGIVTHIKELQQIHRPNTSKYILSLAISPNTQYLAVASSNPDVDIYELKQNTLTHLSTLQGHKNWVWDCEFTPDSILLATCSSDGTARLWDIKTQETIQVFKGHQKRIFALHLQCNHSA